MVNKKSLIIILLASLTVAALLISYEFWSRRDVELERKFAATLSEFKQGSSTSMDLQSLLGTSWTKVCIQFPYEFQGTFEKSVNQKVRGYRYIEDDVNTLWIFYGNKARWVQIKIVDVMNYDSSNGVTCTPIQHPFIYFRLKDNAPYPSKRVYYFMDNKES